MRTMNWFSRFGSCLATGTLLLGCVTGRTPIAQPNVARTQPITGHVSFDARNVTARGYSRLVHNLPARFVRVMLLDKNGATLTEGTTDAKGDFQFAADPRATKVAARSSLRSDRTDCTDGTWRTCVPRSQIDVTIDPEGERPYEITAVIPADGVAVDLRAKLDTPEQPGGAFHILDTLERGLQAVHLWAGRTMPPMFVVWQHEGPLTWSYYRGERPAHSGRYVLELMGGERGAQATSDSDEHDDVVILHEFGHFVFDVYSTNSSVGGMHPRQALVHPGLAWEEGRASWFAACVLRDSMYRDAIGIEPRGSLRVEENLERLADDSPRGLGSEGTVMEILWDLADGTLADGTTALEDRDNDGIALGPKVMLEAMFKLREKEGVYPSVVTFLRSLAEQGILREDQARKITAYPSQQRIEMPAFGAAETWPIVLQPGRIHARIDGLTDPAPSGGRAHPDNGFDALQTYRIEVKARSRVVFEMAIRGSGRGRDHSDVDLILRDTRGNMIDSSQGETASERIDKVLEPGVYILDVKDGGSGNRADYDLNYSVKPP